MVVNFLRGVYSFMFVSLSVSFQKVSVSGFLEGSYEVSTGLQGCSFEVGCTDRGAVG